MAGISTKPYLIRAIHEWCVDEGYTPHLAVAIDHNVLVPQGYARDGQIVLNLSPDATNQLSIGNEAITFQARFAGKVHDLYVPIANVMGIYSAQTGDGLGFEVALDEASEEAGDPGTELLGVVPSDAVAAPWDNASDDAPEPPEPPKRGHLKLVK